MSTMSSKEETEMIEVSLPSSVANKGNLDPELKVGAHGVALVPQPSGDPRDPLVSIGTTPFPVSGTVSLTPARTGPP